MDYSLQHPFLFGTWIYGFVSIGSAEAPESTWSPELHRDIFLQAFIVAFILSL